MATYMHQNIEVVLDTESDLYKRICAASEASGKSVEYIIDSVASVGLAHLMDRNLSFYYEKVTA